MNKLLAFSAGIEAVAGLALAVCCPVVARLLLGEDISGAAVAIGRVAGFGLLSLGLACWPSRNTARGDAPAFRAMVTYNLLATLYLLGIGVGGKLVGPLLWPAVAMHAVLTFVLVRAWFNKTSWPIKIERVT